MVLEGLLYSGRVSVLEGSPQTLVCCLQVVVNRCFITGRTGEDLLGLLLLCRIQAQKCSQELHLMLNVVC